MRVVIAGAGSVGTYIAEDLAKAGHEVIIVERDADRVAEAERHGEPAGVTWVAADACEVSEFARAGDQLGIDRGQGNEGRHKGALVRGRQRRCRSTSP